MLSVSIELMVLYDCIEVDRSREIITEVLLITLLLVPTLLILAINAPFGFFFSWRSKINHNVGDAKLYFRNIYYLVFSLQLLYSLLCVQKCHQYRVSDRVGSIFIFLSFESSMSLDGIFSLQNNNVLYCRRFSVSSSIGVIEILVIPQTSYFLK